MGGGFGGPRPVTPGGFGGGGGYDTSTAVRGVSAPSRLAGATAMPMLERLRTTGASTRACAATPLLFWTVVVMGTFHTRSNKY